MSTNGNGHRTDGERLLALASELKLTRREKALAEAYVSGPTAGNGTASARKAGYSGSDDSLAVTASTALKRDRVRRYISALTGEAIARAAEKTEGTISTLAESMEFLTMVQRSRLGDYVTKHGEVDVAALRSAPAGLVRKYGRKVSRRVLHGTSKPDEAGKERHEAIEDEHVQFELESASTAAQALIRHYDGQDRAGATVNVLAVGSLGDLLALALAKRVVP